MRIDAFNKISELYQSSSVKNAAKTKGTGFRDKLEISELGKGYQVAKQAVAGASDIRETTVNDIKQRMEAGTYKVTIQDVADKLIDQYFEE